MPAGERTMDSAMDGDGIELALRFSYITNSLKFCGPQQASAQFLSYLKDRSKKQDVEESLRRFEGLYPYLSLIARKHYKHFLDYDVVEAYWIGNNLLEDFTIHDLAEIIDALAQRGLPATYASTLKKRLIPGMVPHHNFNVLFIGAGKTTGSVPTTLRTMDNCRTSWGEVAQVTKTALIVQTRALKHDGNSFFLGEEETKTAVYNPTMLSDIKEGAVVALHWGFACAILSKKQQEALAQYTTRIIDSVNCLGLPAHRDEGPQAHPRAELSQGRFPPEQSHTH